ncbi:hypothetical protein ACOMHN_058712 [Nucella lapillus]
MRVVDCQWWIAAAESDKEKADNITGMRNTDPVDIGQLQQSPSLPVGGASVNDDTSASDGKASDLKEDLRHMILQRTAAGLSALGVDGATDPEYKQLTAEEMDKKERRKEQNRRAARRFRAKTKSQNETVLQKNENLKERNRRLRLDIKAIEKHLNNLEKVMRTHEMAGCRLRRTSAGNQGTGLTTLQALGIKELDLESQSDPIQTLDHSLKKSEHRQSLFMELEKEFLSVQLHQQPENCLSVSGHKPQQPQQEKSFLSVRGQPQQVQQKHPQQQSHQPQQRPQDNFIPAPRHPQQHEASFLSGLGQQQQQVLAPQQTQQQQQMNCPPELATPWQHQQQNQDDNFPLVPHHQQRNFSEMQNCQQQQQQGQESWVSPSVRTSSRPAFMPDITNSRSLSSVFSTSPVSAACVGKSVPTVLHSGGHTPGDLSACPPQVCGPGGRVSSQRPRASATMVRPTARASPYSLPTPVKNEAPCAGPPTPPRHGADADRSLAPPHSAAPHPSPPAGGMNSSPHSPFPQSSSPSFPFLSETAGSLHLPSWPSPSRGQTVMGGRETSLQPLTVPPSSLSRGLGGEETSLQPLTLLSCGLGGEEASLQPLTLLSCGLGGEETSLQPLTLLSCGLGGEEASLQPLTLLSCGLGGEETSFQSLSEDVADMDQAAVYELPEDFDLSLQQLDDNSSPALSSDFLKFLDSSWS